MAASSQESCKWASSSNDAVEENEEQVIRLAQEIDEMCGFADVSGLEVLLEKIPSDVLQQVLNWKFPTKGENNRLLQCLCCKIFMEDLLRQSGHEPKILEASKAYRKCMTLLIKNGVNIDDIDCDGFDVVSLTRIDKGLYEWKNLYPFVGLPLERLPKFFQMVERRSKFKGLTSIKEKSDLAKTIADDMVYKYTLLQVANEVVQKKREKKEKKAQEAIEEEASEEQKKE